MGCKVRPLRELKDSVWRVQYIGEDPDLFDDFYQALKRKADKKATAVIETKVDKLDFVLTWFKECTYNAADSWVHQGLKQKISTRVYRLKSEHSKRIIDAFRRRCVAARRQV